MWPIVLTLLSLAAPAPVTCVRWGGHHGSASDGGRPHAGSFRPATGSGPACVGMVASGELAHFRVRDHDIRPFPTFMGEKLSLRCLEAREWDGSDCQDTHRVALSLFEPCRAAPGSVDVGGTSVPFTADGGDLQLHLGWRPVVAFAARGPITGVWQAERGGPIYVASGDARVIEVTPLVCAWTGSGRR